MPNALLVYPEHPPTYWGANFALEITGIKAAFPPLGLLTVAAMFPSDYDLRVVDMNVSPLEDADLHWADMAFTSTMVVQRVSLRAVVEHCNRAGVPVVAGGPHPTTFHDEIEGVDHFVLDEVEEVFPEFLADLENGSAKRFYRAPRRPDVARTPVPRFDLVDLKNYDTMCVQFSRGCPFDCEFCDITKLYGRVPRTKSPDQVIEEFDSLYRLGWRGQVFVVDDNFIGNKRDALNLLPALANWQKARGYPFTLMTEASVNLAQMDELMEAMSDAGFDTVFVGIETPTPEALLKTRKPQNVSKREEEDYLLNAVRRIQRRGMQVHAGFILGLDGDGEDVFDAQIEFIQEAGIPAAAIYLLTALKGTDLYSRLKTENRLLEVPIGTSATTLNFRTQLDPKTLLDGYRRVTTTLYGPTLETYFERCLTLFEHLEPSPHVMRPRSRNAIYAHVMALRRLFSDAQAQVFLEFVATVSRRFPRMLPKAVFLAGLGYHFERIARQQAAIQDFREFLAAELNRFAESAFHQDRDEPGIEGRRRASFGRVEQRYRAIPDEFRYLGDGIEDALESFRSALNERSEQSVRAAAV